MIDRNKGLLWFIFNYFFNNFTGKTVFVGPSFHKFSQFVSSWEVYWQKGFDVIQSRSYNTNN